MFLLLQTQVVADATSHPIRDWSGWVLTVLSVLWNIRQHFALENAKSQVENARQELHRQRVLQVVTNLTATVSHLSYLIDNGRRPEVRQECFKIAGDLAHLRTYGGTLFADSELEEINAVARDIQNVVQTTGKSEDEVLVRDEKAAMRNFCSAAAINMRAYQGRFEKAQDLQEEFNGGSTKR